MSAITQSLEQPLSKEIKLIEKHRRSIAKSITYRLISISVDTIVAYFLTRNVSMTAGIVLFVDGYSTVLYYLHERLWAHINWGREKKHNH